MQRFNRGAIRQSARILRRLMSTESSVASEASASSASVASKEATTQAVHKTATTGKPMGSGKPSGAPKSPKAPKKGGNKKGYIYGTLAFLLGGGSLYRYHSQNDHLSCINKVKGGNNSNILETLYLVPKNLESKYENYVYTTYCDRLIYEIVHNNPMNFKNMEDVVDYFSRWFSTLGLDIDNKAPITEEALVDLFSEFSKEENAFNVYIIGERYFHISPMTDYLARYASRYFDCQRIRRNKQLIIPMEKVVNIIEHMEEKTKETYFTSAFIPNFANKLFSSESRSVKKEKLVQMLKKDERRGMGVYEFVNLMATMERQTANRKFYFYCENYVDRMVGESLFDHDREEEEEEEEEPVVEPVVEEVVEPVIEEVEPEIPVIEEPVKELTLDDWLVGTDRVNSLWWSKLLHADLEGLKNVQEEKRTICNELNKMEWWYIVY